jgi:hypothetical protein
MHFSHTYGEHGELYIAEVICVLPDKHFGLEQQKYNLQIVSHYLDTKWFFTW